MGKYKIHRLHKYIVVLPISINISNQSYVTSVKSWPFFLCTKPVAAARPMVSTRLAPAVLVAAARQAPVAAVKGTPHTAWRQTSLLGDDTLLFWPWRSHLVQRWETLLVWQQDTLLVRWRGTFLIRQWDTCLLQRYSLLSCWKDGDH